MELRTDGKNALHSSPGIIRLKLDSHILFIVEILNRSRPAEMTPRVHLNEE